MTMWEWNQEVLRSDRWSYDAGVLTDRRGNIRFEYQSTLSGTPVERYRYTYGEVGFPGEEPAGVAHYHLWLSGRQVVGFFRELPPGFELGLGPPGWVLGGKDYHHVAPVESMPEIEERLLGAYSGWEWYEVAPAINGMITGRTQYGLREDKSRGTLMFWSNGAEAWIVDPRPPQSAILDANELVVPFPRRQVSLIAGFLDPLPLFRYSLEARERGVPGAGPPPFTTGHWLAKWLRRN